MHDWVFFLSIILGILLLGTVLFVIMMRCELKELDKIDKQRREEIHLLFKPLTQEQIDDIHSRGKITPEEKFYEWVHMDLCPHGDNMGGALDRCRKFDNCRDCRIDLANQMDEYEPLLTPTTHHIID